MSKYWDNITQMALKQEEKGLATYGQTLEENTDLSVVERIAMAQEEAIDILMYLEHLKAHQRKYRWHDLIENPNDLPEYYKDVLVAYWDKETHETECDGEPNISIAHYGVASPIGNSVMEIWNYPFQYFSYGYEIIAWKEIESYKKEVTE